MLTASPRTERFTHLGGARKHHAFAVVVMWPQLCPPCKRKQSSETLRLGIVIGWEGALGASTLQKCIRFGLRTQLNYDTALLFDWRVSVFIAEHAVSTSVADHANVAADALALGAVGVRALQAAFPAELGARRWGLSAAGERGASHVCYHWWSSAVY